KLYNTLSRQNDVVFPSDGNQFRFYCCGPTVYGPAHIGNFRTFILQDVFRRVCEGLGMETFHVRNITDVDDKTIRGSQAAGQSLNEFTTFWRTRFEQDSERLSLKPPHVAPSAVEHIAEQIDMIKALLDKGLAYKASDESVYFRIAAWPDYGKLSGLRLEDLRVNADQRLNSDDEYAKEGVGDFALWKAWKPEDGENAWDSPWGRGRPGWHIECSAMSCKYLGSEFDLHSGGVDLIFPHHENEIAQTCGALGGRFARHWFHVAHLRIEGEKMSKSLGNLFTLDDVVSWGHTEEELRFVLLSGHYRQPLNFTRDNLNAAASALKRLRAFSAALQKQGSQHIDSWGRFHPVVEALCEDINTPKALGALFSVVGEAEMDFKSGGGSAQNWGQEADSFRKIMEMFGFSLKEPAAIRISVPTEIELMARQRWEAKQNKEWARADALRQHVLDSGWMIKDVPGGYELEQKI
ncbi:MAG: cysteine--tRNA ligase, partial [Candidatus Methylacidiphilales bacterium]